MNNSNSGSKFAYAPKKRLNLTEEQLGELDKRRQDWIERQYLYFDFSDNNALAYDLRKGEIYEVDWGMNVNAEFSGRHYGVVLADSAPNNPLVLMCPLKTNHKPRVNPKSDYYVGEIKGLPVASKTVAVLNQIRSVDKIRIYTQLAIGPKRTNYRCEEKDGEEPIIYRLDEYKVNKIAINAAKLLLGLDPNDGNQGASGGMS